MKKLLMFVGLFLILILSLGVFVSAGFFDIFKTTGKVTWEISELTGACAWEYSPSCISNSKSECELNSCTWRDDLVEVSDSLINVNQGWNLMWGFFYPGLMSYSEDLTPNNVKSIYTLNSISKNYVEMYPFLNNPGIDAISAEYTRLGYYPGIGKGDVSFLSWVYFDKAGSFKFRLPPGFATDSGNTRLFSGWNFVGVLPGMFHDLDGVKQNSFKLDDLKGSCNIEKAYFFGGTYDNPTITNDWVEVGINDLISDVEMYRALAVQVTKDCILGKIDHQKTCEDTDGSKNLKLKGTVTIKDNGGNIISTETDSCGQNGLIENYCNFNINGDMTIGTTEIGEGSGWCNSCVDGACV